MVFVMGSLLQIGAVLRLGLHPLLEISTPNFVNGGCSRHLWHADTLSSSPTGPGALRKPAMLSHQRRGVHPSSRMAAQIAG
ncbi:hypothetical protein BSLG_010690 [Batrachochytrium salamandrivorans]|nr:hypothetical protein BSLG_010690 [Batrachochytrium salamandrivorans]